MTKSNNIKNRRGWRKSRNSERKESWWTSIKGLLKKAWESTVVKALTAGLFALSGFLYWNYFTNPYIDFEIKVEVLDAQTGRGINGADIFVQDTDYHFSTGDFGKGEKTIKVRKNTDHLILTCSSDYHQTQEKKIDVLLQENPEFPTMFVLDPR